MFVPLAHPPGHAQADFGEATAIIGGVAQKAHVFVMAPAPRRLLCAGLSGGDCGGLGGRLEARGSAAI
jgi:hypothetical protein